MTYRHKRRLVSISILAVLLLILALLLLAFGPGRRYLRAAALLQRIADGRGNDALADYNRHPVDEMEVAVATAGGPVPARLYVPRGVVNPPGMVVVHGVHRLGIQEPRLMAFARAIAAGGVVVLTPELKDVVDYRITQESIETIGEAALSLHDRLGGKKVGVLGLSFSGGLSLMAASEARFAAKIGFVVSIGGHDDLARVCEFFGSDKIEHPDGTVEELKAHEYGELVLVYSHPEDFFSPRDVPAARDAIRFQLWEKMEQSQAALARLSPAGRAKMEVLLAHKKDGLRSELLACARRHADGMSKVSPHGNLGELQAPALLLHGEGDTVIPASETLWLEQDVPAKCRRARLITPLLTHVDVGQGAALKDKLALINFLAAMLNEADRCAGEGDGARNVRQLISPAYDFHSAELHGGHSWLRWMI